jgi:hypothetical protein
VGQFNCGSVESLGIDPVSAHIGWMKFSVARWICLAFGVLAMAAWLLFNSPLTTLLAIVAGIACEVATWWGLFEQEKGQPNDPQTP